MVYRGQVCGDVIVLPKGVHLPEGIEVLVEPLVQQPLNTASTGVQMRNGVPVFPRGERTDTPNLDLVNELRDEAP